MYIQDRPISRACPAARSGADSSPALPRLVGDSVTTYHISPAGRDQPTPRLAVSHPAGRHPSSSTLRLTPRQPPRHETRDVRERPPQEHARAATRALSPPRSERRSVPSSRPLSATSPRATLVALAGHDYGMGRRATGLRRAFLLGVRAAIAESFEFIHRPTPDDGHLAVSSLDGEGRESPAGRTLTRGALVSRGVENGEAREVILSWRTASSLRARRRLAMLGERDRSGALGNPPLRPAASPSRAVSEPDPRSARRRWLWVCDRASRCRGLGALAVRAASGRRRGLERHDAGRAPAPGVLRRRRLRRLQKGAAIRRG